MKVRKSGATYNEHQKKSRFFYFALATCILAITIINSIFSNNALADSIPELDPSLYGVHKTITDTVSQWYARQAIQSCQRQWPAVSYTSKLTLNNTSKFDGGEISAPLPGNVGSSSVPCEVIGSDALVAKSGEDANYVPNWLMTNAKASDIQAAEKAGVTHDQDCFNAYAQCYYNGNTDKTVCEANLNECNEEATGTPYYSNLSISPGQGVDDNIDGLKKALGSNRYGIIQISGNYLSQITNGVKWPQPGYADFYVMNRYALDFCGEVKTDGNGNGDFDIRYWNEEKQIWELRRDGYVIYSDGEDKEVVVSPGTTLTCKEIVDVLNNDAEGYIEEVNACQNDENCEGRNPNPSGGAVNETANASGSDDEEDPCQVGLLGFGWLFCPGANLVDSFLNGFLNWIDSQLNWTMLAENNTAIRERWQNFLNIANIAFAIAFLVMIYSMATSTGLSNYDIKKMLPRLIVVAIAVNVSFYICAAIVDIFNIIGNSIFRIINPDGSTWDISVGVDGWVGIGSNIVAIIGVIFIFGISAIVALAIIFVCLCVREIALIALVVISPIAFVCYLLPNTQKWFQRWVDYFVRLLAIYPMFMAVWGAAKWVASLKGSVTGDDEVMPGFVISLTCMIAPAIAIIPLFKMSGGIMGMVASKAAGSKLASRGQAAQGYMRNRGKQAYHNSMIGRGIDRHRERAKDLDKQVNEGSYAGYNPWRRARQAVNRRVNRFHFIGGAKGVSSDKDLGNFLKNYTYVDGDGNVQHLTDDQMLDYVQGRAAKDADGHIVLAAQNLNAEQIGSGIKALSGDALEDVYGKTTKGGAPVAATDASKRYAHLQATSNMHEIYAKHGIDIGKDTNNAYRQMREIATSGEYIDKSGKIQTVSSEARDDIATMLSRFDANAGSADAEDIFNKEAETFRTKRQFSAIKTTVSGFTNAAAKRESDEISQALGSAMKAREFKKNAFKSGASTPPSS